MDYYQSHFIFQHSCSSSFSFSFSFTSCPHSRQNHPTHPLIPSFLNLSSFLISLYHLLYLFITPLQQIILFILLIILLLTILFIFIISVQFLCLKRSINYYHLYYYSCFLNISIYILVKVAIYKHAYLFYSHYSYYSYILVILSHILSYPSQEIALLIQYLFALPRQQLIAYYHWYFQIFIPILVFSCLFLK